MQIEVRKCAKVEIHFNSKIGLSKSPCSDAYQTRRAGALFLAAQYYDLHEFHRGLHH